MSFFFSVMIYVGLFVFLGLFMIMLLVLDLLCFEFESFVLVKELNEFKLLLDLLFVLVVFEVFVWVVLGGG